MTKAYLMTSLIEKMQSPDQDFRFMGLNDLMNEIKQDQSCFVGDEAVENKVLTQVLALVEDKISEVKNQAVKCLGQLIKIIRQSQMETVDEELRDISGLALKTITAELPPDGKIAATACAKLTPKLLGQISNPTTPPEALVETLAILSILISRFPAHLSSATLSPQPLTVLAPLLVHPRPVVRKRAIITLAQFVPISQGYLFTDLLATHVFPFLASNANLDRQRTTVHLVAAVARTAPTQIAPVLAEIVPGVLKAGQRDDDELREGSLQASSSSLLLRCPTEITPYVSSIVQAGIQYIKYDPNYAGDDEDEEMADADDDDEEEAELDEYSDDEDTSYKIRRSATKLLSAIVGTRPELLSAIYKDVSPVLISRFGDREETVRREVWATYVVLLNQTALYGGHPQSKDDSSLKRKRNPETMEVEEGPYSLLKAQVPAMSKALLNQLKSPKTPPATLQDGFALLHALLDVLPGSLASQVTSITTTSKSILSQPPSTTTSTLHLACLSFLALFFATHSPPTFASSLPNLTPALLRSLNERHPRVASETFRVFSALLNAVKPIKPGSEWPEAVYEQSVARLTAHDTDAEVRACAETCIGDLWVCATDVVKSRDRREWEAICRAGAKTEGAVKVVTRVAKEVPGALGDAWVNGCVEWAMGLLKRGGRAGKMEVFQGLDVLLRSYTGGVPAALPPALVPQIKQYLSTADIPLLSQALSLLALLLELAPTTTFPEIESDLLPDIYRIAHSPLVSGAALDSLLSFCAALVNADNQIATHLVPNLVIAVEKAPRADASPNNVAKAVAQIVRSQQAIAAGTIAQYAKNIKKTSKAKTTTVVLSLLILGELGRFIDMSPQQEIFRDAIEHFAAEQEEIRAAASFAAGNIAIGSLQQFLPAIVKIVKSDAKKRLLSLHALKEVVTHCSQGQLEGVADMLWVPLFENSENSEETTRNVAAACLGKLATTHPSRYLPQLHARVGDPSADARATVVSAIRYTFAETSTSYDELLAPLLVDFLSLMLDQDLTVRRLALSALNSAARTKPHLIREHLPALLPSLYKETIINPDLIRTVQMGPWTHKVDDGLDARKTAYETMYTLLDTCLAKLELPTFLGRVLPGLADDSDEIKVISHMMLFRLSQVAPAAVSQKLDEATPELEKTMKGATVTKDTVKQDLERAAELQRSALRAVAALSKIAGNGASPRFDAFVEELKKNPQWGAEFKELAAQA
ncbi:Cullin-associated nedd8-dissociated protein 1 [Mycena sanguinolenta]|uniref:Cullin-associated nedd8-dissociated protein 1 n=1 Tax=Mycena sanguinolenta TaxID=230812 RepID=A0A8H7D0Y8_9AGAR|nr:Cullin-associated nedd8-dissociated protein 1 [Mycena sanguinolenta]